MRPALLIPLFACLFGADCHAQELSGDTGGARLPSLSNELRLGGFRHDPSSSSGNQSREKLDLHAELLLRLPSSLAESLWAPRLHLGGSLNSAGRTSHAFAGLAWTYDLTQNLFAEASIGGAVVGTPSQRYAQQTRNDMGCATQFREALALGYRLSADWSVITSVEHLSNAGLCARNRGMTNIGAMVGYRF